jgi:hypothetical protein
MRKYYRLSVIVISIMLFFLLNTFGSIAQTSNDPTVNNDANACFEGGTLYDSCNTTDVDDDGNVDQTDKDWLWTCGWYLIRVESGIFSDDVLDGICQEIIDVVVEEVIVTKKKEKKYCSTYDVNFGGSWTIYELPNYIPGNTVYSDPGYPDCGFT